jgi:hypothetical protein
MPEIEDFVKDDKSEAVMKEIQSNPALYTGLFMRIHSKLCRHCRAKVYRKFLNKQNTNLDEYCVVCRKMAEREFENANKSNI